MPANPPQGSELLALKRQAFLLHQLSSAPDGTLPQTKANQQIPKQIKVELSLLTRVVNGLRADLHSQGFLTKQKVKRSVHYTLTDAGRGWLRDNQHYIPLRPANGSVHVASDESVQQRRVAYLLFQLVNAPADGFTPTELKKKLGSQESKLKLNPATARLVLSKFAEEQLITVSRTARAEKYRLTPSGYAHLVALSFDDLGEITLSGSALTLLLRTARGITAPVSQTPSPPLPPPTTAQLEAAVLESVAKLRAEKHANTGLVPIHEVRLAIRLQFGEEAASHHIFDEVVYGLRRTKKVDLLSISDRSGASEEQLRDSIVGVGETFFYLENAHESTTS